MGSRLSVAVVGAWMGIMASASAAQVDLGPMVPGTSLSHVTSFSGALDDTLTFTLAADAVDFRGSANSAFSFGAGGVPLTIQDFRAELVGPAGYRSTWGWAAVNLGSFGIPFFVEYLSGQADTLAAGNYSLHITGTGQANDAYDLHMGVAAVPEPASAALSLAGLAAIAGWRRRRARMDG